MSWVEISLIASVSYLVLAGLTAWFFVRIGDRDEYDCEIDGEAE